MEKNSFFIHCQYFLIFFLFISCLASPPLAYAQTSSGGIQLEPAFQEITLTNSTATAATQIKITNTGPDDLEFDLQAISIQQFDMNGSIVLADKPIAGKDISLASFVKIQDTPVQIRAGSTSIIPIQVTNSQALGPGGHYAALVAKLNQGTTTNQVVLPAISSFLLVRKEGGEKYNLSLIESSFNSAVIWTRMPEKIDLRFSNQGNIHVIPRGTIEIKDQFQRSVAKAIVNENSLFVFPGTERTLSHSLQPLRTILPLSLLTITVQGISQPGEIPFNQTAWLLYLNPLMLVVIGFVMVVCIFILMRMKNYARRRT